MWYKKIMNKTAQASSAEFLVGYFIFFLVLTMALTLWVETTIKIQNSQSLNIFEQTAVDIAEKLVRTRGVPADWGRANVTVIGLADDPRVLSDRKVAEFLRVMNDSSHDNSLYLDNHCSGGGSCTGLSDYECNKCTLGAGKYDFYVSIKDINGTVIKVGNTSCTAGKAPPANITQEVTVTRTALVDNQIARLELTLWSDKEEML